MTWLLIKLLIRFVAFGAVFDVFSHRSEKIHIKPRYALPLVALVFALLNAGLYWVLSWVLSPVLQIATLGLASLFMPFLLNAGFLMVTTRLMQKLRVDMKIDGFMTIVRLACLLTLAHGALYLALDVLAA